MTYTPGKVIGSTEIRISQEFDGPEAASTTAGIQEALDDLPVWGGAVLIPAGVHIISSTIIIDKNDVKIYGMDTSSMIYLDDGSDCDMIDLQGQRNIEISHLALVGNKAAQASGSGIVGLDSQVVTLDEVHIADMKEYGIHIDSAIDNPHIAVKYCEMVNCDLDGVSIDAGYQCHIVGCHIGGCRVGIRFANGAMNRTLDNEIEVCIESGIVYGIEAMGIIINNTPVSNDEYGIVAATCTTMNVSNNTCHQNGFDNIYIWRTIHSKIEGNTATNAGMGYSGIHVEGEAADDADNNLIADNLCTNIGVGDQDIGIFIEGGEYARDNIVRNNQCLHNFAAGIIDGGERTQIYEGHTDLFMDVQAEVANFIHQNVGTGAAFVVLEPAFTGAQLDVPRNVTVDCTAVGAPTGDITITGVDALGNNVSEDITVNPGGQAVGNVAFAYVATINVPATIPGTDTIQVGNGSKLGLANMFFDATYSVYKCTKNNADYTGVGSWTISIDYFTVDVSTGGAIANGDDFTIWYRTDTNQVV